MNTPTVVRVDVIECPKCLTVQEAKVTWTVGDFWPIFLHWCRECNYMIMESEWEPIENASTTVAVKLPMGVTLSVFAAYLCEKLPDLPVVVDADTSDDMHMEFQVRGVESMAVQL